MQPWPTLGEVDVLVVVVVDLVSLPSLVGSPPTVVSLVDVEDCSSGPWS